MVARRRCDGIIRIHPRHHLKHRHGIGHGARHRSGDVAAIVERHHTSARGQPHRRADSHERLMRRRSTDRVPRIGTESDLPFVCGNGGCSTTTGSGSHAIKRVWVLRIPGKYRTHCLIRRERPLGEIRLGQDDGARVTHTSHKGRVAGWDPPLECERTGGGLQVTRLVVVLHDHWNTVQRSHRTAGGIASVERVGHEQRLCIDRDERVDRGAALVVARNAVEIGGDQVMAGQPLAGECCVHLGDRRLLDTE